MLLTQEIQERLKALCDGESKITIEGFNAFGDSFTTKGKVSKGDEGKPVVYEDVVYVDFGHREGRPYSSFVAPFKSEVDMSDTFGKSLVIKKITLENGEVLFENADADKYLQVAKANMEKYKKQAEAEGRWIEEHDGVSSELMSLLGKPIVLDGQEGVLAELPRKANNFGGAMITVRSTSLAGGLHVNPGSTLETVNLETGEREYVVSKKEYEPREVIAIHERRSEKIKKASGAAEEEAQPGDVE